MQASRRPACQCNLNPFIHAMLHHHVLPQALQERGLVEARSEREGAGEEEGAGDEPGSKGKVSVHQAYRDYTIAADGRVVGQLVVAALTLNLRMRVCPIAHQRQVMGRRCRAFCEDVFRLVRLNCSHVKPAKHCSTEKLLLTPEN